MALSRVSNNVFWLQVFSMDLIALISAGSSSSVSTFGSLALRNGLRQPSGYISRSHHHMKARKPR